MFTVNGEEWKQARNLFASGFNSAYILSQTGHVVEQAETYVRILKVHARTGEIFLLQDVNLAYTMDIAGVLTL